MTRIFVAMLCIVVGVMGVVWPAYADKRVALLIGNAAYARAPLVNPVRDVSAMKQALTTAGFDVVDARTDLDRSGMIQALGSSLLLGSRVMTAYCGQ